VSSYNSKLTGMNVMPFFAVIVTAARTGESSLTSTSSASHDDVEPALVMNLLAFRTPVSTRQIWRIGSL
jgi:hypothetical protein